VGSLVRSRLRITIHVVDDSPAHTRRPLTCHHCQTPTPGRGTRRRDSVRAMPIMRRLLLATAPATIWKPRGSQRSLHLGAPSQGDSISDLARIESGLAAVREFGPANDRFGSKPEDLPNARMSASTGSGHAGVRGGPPVRPSDHVWSKRRFQAQPHSARTFRAAQRQGEKSRGSLYQPLKPSVVTGPLISPYFI
jgi:hypothetical protein